MDSKSSPAFSQSTVGALAFEVGQDFVHGTRRFDVDRRDGFACGQKFFAIRLVAIDPHAVVFEGSCLAEGLRGNLLLIGH